MLHKTGALTKWPVCFKQADDLAAPVPELLSFEIPLYGAQGCRFSLGSVFLHAVMPFAPVCDRTRGEKCYSALRRNLRSRSGEHARASRGFPYQWRWSLVALSRCSTWSAACVQIHFRRKGEPTGQYGNTKKKNT